MASKSVSSVALILLFLNLIFFSMVSSDSPAPSPASSDSPAPSPASSDSPAHSPASSPPRECPELGVCVNVLGGRVIGNPSPECCSILGGLAQFQANVCICDKLRFSVLGMPIDIKLDVIAKKILNTCGRNTTNDICN